MPTLPRLPLLPDVLRRIELPADLDAATTIGEEEDPGAGGMTRDGVELILEGGAGPVPEGALPPRRGCAR